ncbi:MAG: hypothetical protein CCU27_15085, partial [Nitrospira sp. UW-LDO-02]
MVRHRLRSIRVSDRTVTPCLSLSDSAAPCFSACCVRPPDSFSLPLPPTHKRHGSRASPPPPPPWETPSSPRP